MSVTVHIKDKTAEIAVIGLLDAKMIKSVAGQADKAVAAGVGAVKISFAEVTGIDSAGITGILHLRAGLLDRGIDMNLHEATPELAATLRLLKVHNLLNLEKKDTVI